MAELDEIFEEFGIEEPAEEPAEVPEVTEAEKEAEKPEEAEEEKIEELTEEKMSEEESVAEAAELEEWLGEEVPEEKAPEKPKEEIVKPPPVPEKEDFDYSQDKGTMKEVYCIYGLKGEGKTYLAFTFPGKIACLSFDRKSTQVKKRNFNNDDRIVIYDCIRYLDMSSPESFLKSSEKTLRYVNSLLDKIVRPWEPDWVVIDGTEIFQRICEMTMRYRNNLMPFQGIANRNLWKERRLYISQLHNQCISIAKKGVIYTTYTDQEKIVKDGELVTLKDVPRWIDAIMYETDTVIRVEARRDKSGHRFFATVESSKTTIPTGAEQDITNKGISVFLGGK